MSEMPGLAMAQHRLAKANGSIFEAFDSLDVCAHELALAYLEAPLARVPKEVRGYVAGVALGLALTAVEADRERRRHLDAVERAAPRGSTVPTGGETT